MCANGTSTHPSGTIARVSGNDLRHRRIRQRLVGHCIRHCSLHHCLRRCLPQPPPISPPLPPPAHLRSHRFPHPPYPRACRYQLFLPARERQTPVMYAATIRPASYHHVAAGLSSERGLNSMSPNRVILEPEEPEGMTERGALVVAHVSLASISWLCRMRIPDRPVCCHPCASPQAKWRNSSAAPASVATAPTPTITSTRPVPLVALGRTTIRRT